MAFVRPVLDGVLYRAGFKGGDKAHTGLSSAQRTTLCEAGFSGARYVDFGTKTQFGKTSCDGNTFVYEKGSSASVHDIMRDIHSVIENPARGQSWSIACGACTLRRRVGHGPDAVLRLAREQGEAYWHKARNNAPCGSGGCDKWIDGKFASFQVDPALKISAEQQRKICPQ